jgi:beta-lactamase regulating signal transducer with metallopeptidase domain/protocatechuate 3,4-dioxygenase beta subunit
MITLLLDYTLRVSIVLILALVAARILRSQSASLRHLVLAAGMLCAAMLPFLTQALPSLEWTPPAEVSQLMPPPVMEPQASMPPPEAEIVPVESMPLSLPPAPQVRIHAAIVVQWIYFVGVGLSFAALLLSLSRLARLNARTQDVRDSKWNNTAREILAAYGIRRPVRLLESSSPSVLATWGLLRPRVVIPAGSSQWSEERIRVVLTHELAHVYRKDWLTQFGAEVFRAVLWFNPIVWITSRRLREESEIACDDAVMNRGIAAPEYAAHLLDLARTLGSPAPALVPALFMARPSTFEKRFQSMLNPRARRGRLTRRAVLCTMAVLLGVVMPLAMLRATPRVVAETVQATAIRAAATIQTAAVAVLQTPQAIAPIPNSIEGMVVRLGSNDPVSEVDVELRRVEGTPSVPLLPLVLPPGNYGPGAIVRPTYPNPADIANARTKSDGRFIFTNLKPGTYRLQAARAGGAYFPAEYGQRSPKGKGYDFPFVEGQAMRDVRLQMAPTGSISGRVLDADGQPAARVRVMALEATYSLGERKLGIIQAIQTDDRGEYRMFWLPPGQYVIAARQEDPRRQTLQLFITPPGSKEGYETYSQAPLTFRTLENGTVIEETFEAVYYGGDGDPQNARTIDLPPGGSVTGIDMNIAGSRVRTRHVRGTLMDPSGARVPGVTVSALPRNSGPSMVAPTAITDATGTFDLAGVGTGAYTLRGALPGFAGYALLAPGESDVDGLTISMSLGFRLQGKITIDGRAPGSPSPELAGVTVRLENTVSGLPGAGSGAINGDSFTMSVPQAGLYRVLVNPLLAPYNSNPALRPAVPPDLQNAYVKTIRFNADDGLSGPVNLTPQAGQLEVVVALNGGTIEGVVRERQAPAANAVVVLIPVARGRFDLYRVSNSGGDGRFRMRAIPPGEYRLFAWEYVEDGAWFDAAFMRGRESGGRAVRINEGSNPDISLTMERP